MHGAIIVVRLSRAGGDGVLAYASACRRKYMLMCEAGCGGRAIEVCAAFSVLLQRDVGMVMAPVVLRAYGRVWVWMDMTGAGW